MMQQRSPAEFYDVLRDALRNGVEVADAVFDRIYPENVRELSKTHWTPVAVARRAAALLVSPERPARIVLDVGSGAGKLCIIGGLLTGAVFVGAERRRWLADAASRAAGRLRAERTTCFIERDALQMDWSTFDAIYLFNPFYENLDSTTWIDTRVELGRDQYARALAATRARLTETQPGTRVVTYHGFGAPFPGGFTMERREEIGSDALEVWVRT